MKALVSRFNQYCYKLVNWYLFITNSQKTRSDEVSSKADFGLDSDVFWDNKL